MDTLEPIAVRVKVLFPEDSLGKAAEAVRASAVGAVPVVDGGIIVGLATAASLANALDEGPVQGRRVQDLELEASVSLPETWSPREALAYLRAAGLERAPVVDRSYGLIGMVSTAELVGALFGRIRLPMIGGMATPFGVYLTGGGVRGGVGDWALVSTGVYLGLLNMVAALAAAWLLTPGRELDRFLASVRWLGPEQALGLVTYVLFAVLFRLSWITGYHAAEHQVVHTLEAGDDLVPEVVARKPRVHPRCGTNLVMGMLILTSLLNLTALWGMETAVIVAVMGTFFFWRRLGAVAQQYVTTRPASRKQLESGIRAAEQLIEQYRQGPRVPLTLPRRIWNMGLIQVLAGWTVIFGLWALLSALAPVPEAFRLSL